MIRQTIPFRASLLLLTAAAFLSAAPAQAGEVPGKTNVHGFYPTWYFPGHRTCHGTQWTPCQCGRAPWRRGGARIKEVPSKSTRAAVWSW